MIINYFIKLIKTNFTYILFYNVKQNTSLCLTNK